MKSDIAIIGGGASGLMASFHAAGTLASSGIAPSVTVFEKMPRAARKVMITGKGRCNFTNIKCWNDFSQHIRSKASFIKPSFYNFPPEKVVDFFESHGMHTVVERGDRAFPRSYLASDVVDTLVLAAKGVGVKIETDFEVSEVKYYKDGFSILSADGRCCFSRRLILSTGGLSYPSTGSTGDGYRFAGIAGHTVVPTFPSLTALVPKGYKEEKEIVSDMKGHIDRCSPLSSMGKALCGKKYKLVDATLLIDGNEVCTESGELFYTDGGVEGPVVFQLSRRAVKAMVNGSRVSLSIKVNPLSPEREQESYVLDIAGFVGYERAVVTAGGISTEEFLAKTMESRLSKGLYACGEVLDADADTGGYNLQIAFCTGALAGQSAARSILF